MTVNFFHFTSLLAALIFTLLAAFLLVRRATTGFMVRQAPQLIALFAIAIAIGSLVGILNLGSGTSGLIGIHELGLASRVDAISITMLLLVASIGWVVLRYSANYLLGEQDQPRFMGLMTATLASVILLVTAGNLLQLVLGWAATGLFLHKLLLFYPNRIAARRAARKKFFTARLGDGAVLIAAGLLYLHFGTGDIAAIAEAAVFDADAGSLPMSVLIATMLLALAALLKSAQFPVHGWLTEAMETPTPVSALLHAGVINAGGFLLIRFADVMLMAPGVLAVLVMVGGFTALFGGLVMLTQPQVKTSLAWSTIAQMGFMIMQCGLALFPLALLHIVAHSLYKAHAFLASGSAVETVAAIRRPGPVAVPSVGAVGRSFLVALLIYAAIGTVFGLADKSPQAIALGAILIFGVAYLLAQGLADKAPKALTRRTAAYALAAAIGYFTLQRIAEALMAGTLPATPTPGPLEWALIVLAVLSFGLVALAQALFPLWAFHPAAAGLRVHLANGLYINALFDRITKGWTNPEAGPSGKEHTPS